MIITHAERRFRTLLVVWLILFAGGTVGLTVAGWLPFSSRALSNEPFMAFAWIGQLLLFLCILYLLSGIRDNELIVSIILCYKLVSGSAMMLFLVNGVSSSLDVAFVIFGGFLDYAMGAVTLWLWLLARRSCAKRTWFDEEYQKGVSVERTSPLGRLLRIGLAISAGLFVLVAIALLGLGLFFIESQDSTAKIALGNAVAVYASLACLCSLSSKSSQRYIYAYDVVVASSYFASFVFANWLARFPLSPSVRTAYVIGALAHLIIAVLLCGLHCKAETKERRSVFWGCWLHNAFERFSEVVIEGDNKVMTGSEMADEVDNFLRKIPSRHTIFLKAALLIIELGPLLRFRAPMSRLGRLERKEYLISVYQRGHGLCRAIIEVRKLAYLIYYSDERAQRQTGYIPVHERQRYQEAIGGGYVYQE